MAKTKNRRWRMKNASRYDQNKKHVITSPIIAKAAIQRKGHIEIVAVFQGSTRQEFYWTFRARTPRSPQRSWTLINYYSRDHSQYSDFGSFLENITWHGGILLSQRVLQARRLAVLQGKTAYESIHTDWTPQNPERMCGDRVDEKYRRARLGKLAFVRYG